MLNISCDSLVVVKSITCCFTELISADTLIIILTAYAWLPFLSSVLKSEELYVWSLCCHLLQFSGFDLKECLLQRMKPICIYVHD